MLTTEQLWLCQFQAELFEASVEKTDCSSAVFLRRFFLSQLARQLDAMLNTGRIMTIDGAFEEIEHEFGTSSYGKVKYGANELHWIGYLTRYWCIADALVSRNLYRLIKPAALRRFYRAYHSLDPLGAIERIKESEGLCTQPEADINKRAMAFYRRKMEQGLFGLGL